ncbi:hypothetical protein [Gordonia malaquae]|uniref:hypothetical protein n=1 Tax=Gordonia malaquae TaxID=410332 RepID=UPI003017F94A
MPPTTALAAADNDGGEDLMTAIAHMSAKACDAKHGTRIADHFENTDDPEST